MSVFRCCKHRWEETGWHFHEPAMAKLEHADHYVFRLNVLGATIVTLRCRLCGDVRTKELLGKVWHTPR